MKSRHSTQRIAVSRPFVAAKLRETMINPFNGELLYRVRGDRLADSYASADGSYECVLEMHAIVPALEEWERQVADKIALTFVKAKRHRCRG